MSSLPSLESIEIGDNCFKDISNDLRFRHFPLLESLKIGRKSFYNETNGDIVNRVFEISNCSNLLSIEIGEYSFSNFGYSFSLSSLPSLQNLTIGSIDNDSYNFMYLSNLIISGTKCIYMNQIIDLPNLQSMTLGRGSFDESISAKFSSIYVSLN